MSNIAKAYTFNDLGAIELRVIQCGTCGVWHAIPEVKFQKCRDEGGFWYCPNGHSRGYSEGSIYQQLEKEKKRREWAEKHADNMRAQAAEAERRRVAQKAATTRLRKRVKAGICPCCSRHFKQLAAHMKRKHPEYQPEDG